MGVNQSDLGKKILDGFVTVGGGLAFAAGIATANPLLIGFGASTFITGGSSYVMDFLDDDAERDAQKTKEQYEIDSKKASEQNAANQAKQNAIEAQNAADAAAAKAAQDRYDRVNLYGINKAEIKNNHAYGTDTLRNATSQTINNRNVAAIRDTISKSIPTGATASGDFNPVLYRQQQLAKDLVQKQSM